MTVFLICAELATLLIFCLQLVNTPVKVIPRWCVLVQITLSAEKSLNLFQCLQSTYEVAIIHTFQCLQPIYKFVAMNL